MSSQTQPESRFSNFSNAVVRFCLIVIIIFLVRSCRCGSEMNESTAAVDSAATAVDSIVTAVDSVAVAVDTTGHASPDTVKKPYGNKPQGVPIKKPSDTSQNPTTPSEDDFKNLTRGNIAHNIPRQMEVDEWYDAKVSVSKGVDTMIVMSVMPKKGTILSTVLVGKSVSIKLIDPTGENFTIRDLNTEKQQVDDLTGTTWEYKIKPLQPGEKQQLKLIAKTTIGDSERDFTIYDTTIDVETTLTKSVWKFTSSNWAFITFAITVILIPTITMLRKRRRKNKPDY
ncbi:hypothetical protein [Pollutibacter soli]|uniref:hypothetical protein n=1 Tax=Pollutibacter soli TaxID=3034157 RepID=UPI0030139940